MEYWMVNAVISFGAGLFGAGVGVGSTVMFFRSSIEKIRKDLDYVINRQDRLRGADKEVPPVYMTRLECVSEREQCPVHSDQLTIAAQTTSIRRLENYIRWRMNEDGLTQPQITQILG